ncbi:hypothetical protein [Pontibacterium sp.]|uniref:hypothetical protein n=1 Tax=Pontibacterium sp. TaxID=2036026 RepID=UPI0035673D18
MKSGMDRSTGKLITGLAYLFQRLSDVLATELGSLVGARAFGSRLHEMVDHNVDDRFHMEAYIRLAEAVSNPANGLEDFRLKNMRLQRVKAHHIEIYLSGEYDGEFVDLDPVPWSVVV